MNQYKANQILLLIKNNPGICASDVGRHFQSETHYRMVFLLKEKECIREGECTSVSGKGRNFSRQSHNMLSYDSQAKGLYFNKFYIDDPEKEDKTKDSKFLGKRVKVKGDKGWPCPHKDKVGIVTKHEFSSFSGIEPYTFENDYGVKNFVCEIREDKTKFIFYSKCEFLEVL